MTYLNDPTGVLYNVSLYEILIRTYYNEMSVLLEFVHDLFIVMCYHPQMGFVHFVLEAVLYIFILTLIAPIRKSFYIVCISSKSSQG